MKKLFNILLLALLLFALFGCEVEPYEPMCSRRIHTWTYMYRRIFAPVCATRWYNIFKCLLFSKMVGKQDV